MFEIPTTINLPNGEFDIRCRGDYRMVLDCFEILNDSELTKQERLLSCLIVFYDNMSDIDSLNVLGNLEDATKEMFRFFNCNQPEVKQTHNYRLIDWSADAQMIASGINSVANFEVRSVEYMHWWTFMGYYNAIGESTLSTVVGIRQKIAKGTKLEKYEQDFKKDNPQYFTINLRKDEEGDAFADELRKLWEG